MGRVSLAGMGDYFMKGKQMKRVAVLLAAAVLTAQCPVCPLKAQEKMTFMSENDFIGLERSSGDYSIEFSEEPEIYSRFAATFQEELENSSQSTTIFTKESEIFSKTATPSTEKSENFSEIVTTFIKGIDFSSETIGASTGEISFSSEITTIPNEELDSSSEKVTSTEESETSSEKRTSIEESETSSEKITFTEESETSKETTTTSAEESETFSETATTSTEESETYSETATISIEESETYSETTTTSTEESETTTTSIEESETFSGTELPPTEDFSSMEDLELSTIQQESHFPSTEDNAADSTASDEDDKDRNRDYILGREMTPEEIASQKAMEPDYLPELEIVELPEEAAIRADMPLRRKMRAVLPAKYDLREQGNLPAVRDQNPWGACWTFAFLGLMEYSLVQQGLADAESVNLSEHHLAYFTYHTGYDVLDNANDDTIESNPQSYYLQTGGNDYRAALRLMNWQGAAEEAQYPYPNDKNLPEGYSRNSAQDSFAILKRCSFYPAKANDAETRQIVKNLILENGCVSWSYFNDNKFLNYSTGAYYNNERTGTNHAIIVVGWDDDYAKENFNTDTMPEENGAWIVRNSWGSKWQKDGYFYISYEDISLGSGNAVCVAQAERAGKYDNNYFHSNSIGMKQYGKYKKIAQIYQAKSPDAVKEQLAAVSFMIGSAGVDYQIQVYKNPKLDEGVVKDPESGTPMLESPVTGTVPYAGVYTAELPDPVEFDADDYMAIVIEFPETPAFMYCDSDYTANVSSEGSCSAKNTVEAGESLYMLSSTWQDMSLSGRSLRVNALTIDVNAIVKVPTLSIIEMQEAAGFADMPSVLLRWSKCSNVQGYEVYRSLDGQSFEKIASVGADTRQYRDTLSAREESEFFYQVKALYQDETGESSDTVEESNIVNAQFLGVIEGAGLTITYNGKIAEFSWKAVAGADQYELQRREDASGDFETVQIFQGEQTAYSIDAAEYKMGIYNYRIRARKDTEDGMVYSQWSEADLAKDLVVEASDSHSATVAWLPIVGADQYGVKIRIGNTWYIYKIETSPENEKTSYTFQFDKVSYEVKIGEPYQYRMAAYQAGKEIYTSSTIIHCLPPESPLLALEADNAEKQGITLTWSGGNGVTAVDIYRSENTKDKGEQIGTVDFAEGSYIDTAELTLKTAYFYYLEPFAENTAGDKIYGLPTDRVCAYQPPAAPQLEPITEQGSTVVVQWNRVLGAEGYLLEKSVNSGAFVQIADLSADTVQYIDKEVSRCNQYRYRITTYYTIDGGEVVKSGASKVSTIRLLPEPVEIKKVEEVNAGREGMHIAVSLPQIQNAQCYMLYRSENGEDGNYRQIAKITDSSIYLDKEVVHGTTYFYKVLITIDTFTSALKDTKAVSIVTKPKYPAPVTIVSAAESENVTSGTQIVLTIPRIENAQYYLLYRSESEKAETYIQIAKIMSTQNADIVDGGNTTDTITYTDNTVEPDTNYFYKVLVSVNNVLSIMEETTAVSIHTKAEETEESPSEPEETNPDDKDPDETNPDDKDPDETNPDDKDPDETNPDNQDPNPPALPVPISIVSIREKNAGQEGAEIIVSIPWRENAQSYNIYRSENGEKGMYQQIASLSAMQESQPLVINRIDDNQPKMDNVTGNIITFTDKEIQPDTEYFYKVLVTVEKQTSTLENTTATRIVTKPILQSFAIALSERELCQGSSQKLDFGLEPVQYPYTPDELVWTAQDSSGTTLPITVSDDKTIVMGTDGKEVLSIEDNMAEDSGVVDWEIYAIGASQVKTVRLCAALDGKMAAVVIFIYQNEGFQVTGIEDQYYTGGAITPPIRVYDQGKLLTKGVDYSVSYTNNKNAYIKSANDQNTNNTPNASKTPSVIVTGKGNYTGKETVTFSILPIDISDNTGSNAIGISAATESTTNQNAVQDKHAVVNEHTATNNIITVDNLVCAYRKNKTQKPVPTVLWNGTRLKKGRDFTVEYPDTTASAYQDAGVYTVRINGINNFTGTREIALLITTEGLIAKTTVSKIKAQTYTGGEIQPLLTVKSGKRVLVENQDYTVTYENNIDVGTATAVITGTGVLDGNTSIQGDNLQANRIPYYGVKRVTFQIKGVNINKATVNGLDKSVAYTGKPIKQTHYQLTMKTSNGIEVLKEGTDYITIQNSVDAGTGYIIFQGIHAYTGTLKKSFRIMPYDFAADESQQMDFIIETNVPYAKGGAKPDVQVFFGSSSAQNYKDLQSENQKNPQPQQRILLQNGVDYKLTYRNHTTVSGSKTPSVTITGKGNFKGKKTLDFTITKQDIGKLSINAYDKVYTAKAGTYKTKVSVTDLNGKALKAGKDYQSQVIYTYAQSVKLSDGTQRSEGEIVGDKDILPVGTVLNATITGINNYQGSLMGRFRIAALDISKAKAIITPQTYTGVAIMPEIKDITVQYKGRTLAYGSEYIIENCTDNIKKGKGTLYIKGIGDFGGQKKVKFVIRSKKVGG